MVTYFDMKETEYMKHNLSGQKAEMIFTFSHIFS